MVAGMASGSIRWEPLAIRRADGNPVSRPAPSSTAYAAPIPPTNTAVRSSCRRLRSARRGTWPPMPEQVPDQQRNGHERCPDVHLDRTDPGHQTVAGEHLDEPGRQTDDDHRSEPETGQPQRRGTANDDRLPGHEHDDAEAQQSVADRRQPRWQRRAGGEGGPAAEEGSDQHDQQRQVGPPAGPAEQPRYPSRHGVRPAYLPGGPEAADHPGGERPAAEVRASSEVAAVSRTAATPPHGAASGSSAR